MDVFSVDDIINEGYECEHTQQLPSKQCYSEKGRRDNVYYSQEALSAVSASRKHSQIRSVMKMACLEAILESTKKNSSEDLAEMEDPSKCSMHNLVACFKVVDFMNREIKNATEEVEKEGIEDWRNTPDRVVEKVSYQLFSSNC